ncbi:relaxase/mobilization nuclease domain-containing protein [Flavobacterium lindanitolerans]|uniref:relaxase/mobilization nuclease domain-containing protein n=1 Tax=Flavobacterium lindanitolerans TaxID=428988 RepID=UPI0023F297A3|nr:relaxase/mobilization nuclease domain-containing protein [Flavobacterium lindanitolerans]
MVAVIKTGHSIRRIFHYNENKVLENVAVLIGAENYPLDAEKLSQKTKLSILERQLALNANVSRNSVHVSLNFDPSENNLDQEKLVAIANRYMQGIGFANQPYLIYQHHDAGHPHIHIVSIKVKADGKRIDMNNIGRNQSEASRKAIEKEFNLVRAEDQKKQLYIVKPVSPEVVYYGKVQSKRAIQNVLDFVIGNYRYASLPELNAILRQFNVQAERGAEDSRTFQRNGLYYRIIDSHQNPIGIPIKASSFYSKPTLQYLSNRYAENDQKRQSFKQRVKNAIDLLLKERRISIQELSTALQKQGITLCQRLSNKNELYGITYVDHTTKCVFNGSVLGKAYSAKGMQERCFVQKISEQDLLTIPSHPAQKETGLPLLQTAEAAIAEVTIATAKPEGANMLESFGKDILESLLQPANATDYVPGQFKKNKKKRKKRNKPNSNQ